MAKDLSFGAARETRTLMDLGPHGPQPCLSTNFSMAAIMTHIKSMTSGFQIDKF